MANARVSQSAVIVGVQIVPSVRISQSAVIVGVQGEAPARISQSAVIVGLRPITPCLTQEAYLWKITRRDGTVYRFGSHDRPVTFLGEVYSPCDSLETSAIQVNAEIGATGSFDLAGYLSQAGVTELDIWSGKLDGAEVNVWRVSWVDPTDYVLIAAGNLGSAKFRDNSFDFEVVTPAERLKQQPLLQALTPTCRFKLYDERCTVNPAGFTQTGSVTALPSPNVLTQAERRAFTDSTRAEASQFWQLGTLTWTSGNNNGESQDIQSFEGGAFILATPTSRPINFGDTYSVEAGCDRSEATCNSKFSNGDNFGGFPHLKGEDDLNKAAPVK